MIVNKINIEGVKSDDNLKDMVLRDLEIFNSNVTLDINIASGIKDIIQITVNPNIVNKKISYFKDSTLATLTVETNYKILAVENKQSNNLTLFEETEYFNYSIKGNFAENQEFTVDIIDCYYKLVSKSKLVGTLTYIFTKEQLEVKNTNLDSNNICDYRLIDLEKEFY